MATYRENTGLLGINDRKQKENHPDYTGKINVEGKEFYLKGWKKVAKSGLNFMSLSVQGVDDASKPRTEQPKSASVPTNDESPF